MNAIIIGNQWYLIMFIFCIKFSYVTNMVLIKMLLCLAYSDTVCVHICTFFYVDGHSVVMLLVKLCFLQSENG